MSGDKGVSTFDTNNMKKPNYENAAQVTSNTPSVPSKFIHIRVINTELTHYLHFDVKPTTLLVRLKWAYSIKMGLNERALRFMFNGHRITDDETPKKLGLVNNDVIEVYQERYGGGM